MRQLEFIKTAALIIRTPRSCNKLKDTNAYADLLSRQVEDDQFDCLDIASLMSRIRLDPKLLGKQQAVPMGSFHVLAKLGIHQLEDILCKLQKAKPTIIDASELKLRYGSRVPLSVTRKN